ncbi:MAG: HAMP domain-containing protein [Nitriliruptorales bacterium]|nr:HAMP domain-containing protein [Nitriliruptorales bacterium]
MPEAGLSTPLHLAASLLASFASAGLAIMALARPGASGPGRARHPWDVVLATGGLVYAVGHGLAGALIGGSAQLVPWLQGGGLALIAIGVSRPRLRALSGPVVIVPVGAEEQTVWLALISGVVGAVRAAAAGRRALPLAVGLLAWGTAAPATQNDVAWGAALILVGSVAVGWWVWQASTRALRAKLVTASVVLLLGVVVLIAGALSDLGSRDLVGDEVARLQAVSETVADELQNVWPQDAVNAAAILSEQGRTLLDADSKRLAGIYNALFSGQEQEFLIVFDEQGQEVASYAPTTGGPLAGSFVLQVQGAPFVERLVTGQRQRDANLLSIAGAFVVAGGVPLTTPSALPEDPPLGAVVTGRVADAAWASSARRQFNTEIVVSVGNRSTVGSDGVARESEEIGRALGGGGSTRELTMDGRRLYAAASPIEDRRVGAVGRVAAVSEAGALAALEQSQARRLFLLALVGAVLAGAAAAFVSGRLAAPIRRLTEAAAAVREGNLDVAADVGSGDEVGVLGRTFNEMTASLANQSTQLRDAASVQTRLRARLEALTSSMSDALVAVNPDGKVVTFNPAAQRLVGRDITEVLGLPLDQVLVGRAPNNQSPTHALGAFDGEDTVAVQLLLERGDGRFVPTAVTAAPVHDVAGGQILGRVLVLRDVTRDVEVERMKTEFLSNVSHELRTPLTPIKGYAEVLARRDVGPDATRKFASQILDSTGRLERIVATIVDFAALDSGRLELRIQPLPVHELIDEMLNEWRASYEGREFRRRVGRSLPPALADPAMLLRCLDELVSNAVKFSPSGGPISVTAAMASYGRDPSPLVRVSVRDRGVGIEPDMAKRIFSDFYQGDASETRHYGGLGLGLALVRRIIEEMDGHVDLDSRPGAGSTFHLFLPMAHAPPAH